MNKQPKNFRGMLPLDTTEGGGHPAASPSQPMFCDPNIFDAPQLLPFIATRLKADTHDIIPRRIEG